jgi:hypothetical protein
MTNVHWQEVQKSGAITCITEHTFSQFLSMTISPPVARVSAPSTTPSLNKHPTMVVPVLVAFGSGIPLLPRKLFLHSGCEGCYHQQQQLFYLISFEKSKPAFL